MSSQQSLKQFFASKFFNIPKYQRGYAWGKQNVLDLFEDIKEALDVKASHYIGTVVLAKTEDDEIFNIVDGQQRMTTIVMFISVLIRRLEDQGDRDFYYRYYVKEGGQFKLAPLARDKKFFVDVLNGDVTSTPQSKSQRCMLEAFETMESIADVDIDDPLKFLKAIQSLYILEFTEKTESDAVRIFQTVNDRGIDLSKMDKMKSLLFYFSNKYLAGKYDDKINENFGEIYEIYDFIKTVGEDLGVNVISSKQFSEDDILRHHHICFSEESYDPTSQQVLENIKYNLKERRKSDINSLDAYIKHYLESLTDHARAFRRVLSRVDCEADYYKLFVIQGLSAVYYPVVIQLERCGFLSEVMPRKGITVLKMVEIVDLRVFKVRQYGGRKSIANFAYALNNEAMTLDAVEQQLIWFNAYEIGNERFKDYLVNYDYYKQTGLLRALFIDYCERLRGDEYSIGALKKIMASEPTMEHVLSQNPKFEPEAFGFQDEEDFEQHKNLLGNLTILEKKINSAISNGDLADKVKGYGESKFRMTKNLAVSMLSKGFKKSEVVQRGKVLVNDFAKRWWA